MKYSRFTFFGLILGAIGLIVFVLIALFNPGTLDFINSAVKQSQTSRGYRLEPNLTQKFSEVRILPNTVSYIDNLSIKADIITTSQINAIVTNNSTAESKPVSLVINSAPSYLFGHEISLYKVEEIAIGTSSKKQATLLVK